MRADEAAHDLFLRFVHRAGLRSAVGDLLADLRLEVDVADHIVREDVLPAHAQQRLHKKRAGAGAVLACGAVPQNCLFPVLKQQMHEAPVLRKGKFIGQEASVHARHARKRAFRIKRGDAAVGFLVARDAGGAPLKKRDMQIFDARGDRLRMIVLLLRRAEIDDQRDMLGKPRGVLQVVELAAAEKSAAADRMPVRRAHAAQIAGIGKPFYGQIGADDRFHRILPFFFGF